MMNVQAEIKYIDETDECRMFIKLNRQITNFISSYFAYIFF